MHLHWIFLHVQCTPAPSIRYIKISARVHCLFSLAKVNMQSLLTYDQDRFQIREDVSQRESRGKFHVRLIFRESRCVHSPPFNLCTSHFLNFTTHHHHPLAVEQAITRFLHAHRSSASVAILQISTWILATLLMRTYGCKNGILDSCQNSFPPPHPPSVLICDA